MKNIIRLTYLFSQVKPERVPIIINLEDLEFKLIKGGGPGG